LADVLLALSAAAAVYGTAHPAGAGRPASRAGTTVGRAGTTVSRAGIAISRAGTTTSRAGTTSSPSVPCTHCAGHSAHRAATACYLVSLPFQFHLQIIHLNNWQFVIFLKMSLVP